MLIIVLILKVESVYFENERKKRMSICIDTKNYLTRDYYSGFIYDWEKYGGIPQNPPHIPGRKFTMTKLSILKLRKLQKITET
jgi:hypothetical protein